MYKLLNTLPDFKKFEFIILINETINYQKNDYTQTSIISRSSLSVVNFFQPKKFHSK